MARNGKQPTLKEKRVAGLKKARETRAKLAQERLGNTRVADLVPPAKGKPAATLTTIDEMAGWHSDGAISATEVFVKLDAIHRDIKSLLAK